ncbi:MAG: class II fructose-bisphosphate aldolase [Caldisericia bacterium]|nr:class II fructose-bisphosphate aldolase [Caldisericia bacterium]
MLVSLSDVLLPAQKGKYAVGSFNVINLEYAIGIVEAAEELKSPVILQISPSILQLYRFAPIISACKKLAIASSVPVCLHLDHGKDFNTVAKVFCLGFSSVMYDGSLLSFEENVNITSSLVNLAHLHGISVEAEIGIVGKDEENLSKKTYPQSKATDVEEATRFTEKTKIDALAVSVGNIHGVNTPNIQLNIPLLKDLHHSLQIPLVLHGSSGVIDSSIQSAIENGICKINVATRIINQVSRCLIDHYQDKTHFHQYKELINEIILSVKKEVKNRINTFGSSNRA